ncbi:MAG: glycoside hydrolase family 15 protein [Chloroflexota bacterium]
MGPYRPIADYAIIGDARTAALVSRAGSIDWLCLPNFDSPSLFTRLLDEARGGYFAVQPGVDFEVRRRYLAGTNVLETTFTTSDGSARLCDFMPALAETQKRESPHPLRQVVRRLEGLSGRVMCRVAFAPRPGYGRVRPLLRRLAPGMYRASWGSEVTHLASSADLAVDDGTIGGEVVVGPGQAVDLVLNYALEAPAVLPNVADVTRLMEQTIAYWHGWLGPVSYQGPYLDIVQRSALALKLLTFAPSGAIVAAATTSLPEAVGGVRNWDYRYCWLRDAALTLQALLSLGCLSEAQAFMQWSLHATRLTQPRLQAMYSLYGESRLPERTLGHLEGYACSRPVRTGNNAHGQLQLDVYGEFMAAVRLWQLNGGRLDSDTLDFVAGMADYLSDHWAEPDEGIWEVQSGRQQHVHSKAMCCVGLERAAAILRDAGRQGHAERWAEAGARARRYVYTHGYSERLGAYTRTAGGNELDASLLQLPLVGFEDAKEPRMRSTIEAIQRGLSRAGLLYRYLGPDGLPGQEGTFVVCGAWLVQCLAKLGRFDEAHQHFERLLACMNDVGLLAEEFDPATGVLLGNFPQAFSHIGIIDAALALSEGR